MDYWTKIHSKPLPSGDDTSDTCMYVDDRPDTQSITRAMRCLEMSVEKCWWWGHWEISSGIQLTDISKVKVMYFKVHDSFLSNKRKAISPVVSVVLHMMWICCLIWLAKWNLDWIVPWYQLKNIQNLSLLCFVLQISAFNWCTGTEIYKASVRTNLHGFLRLSSFIVYLIIPRLTQVKNIFSQGTHTEIIH